MSGEPPSVRPAPAAATLAAVMAALAAFGASQGLTYPLLTILMQKQGLSPAMIGLSTAMTPLGLILSASLVPSAVRLLGARALAVLAALAAALCFLAIGYLQNWVAWFVVRLILGFVVNPLYILGEVWALALSPPERRGRMMGLFNTLMGVGYAAGPLALLLVGTEGWLPFLVGVWGFVLCAVVLAVASRDLPGFEDEGGDRLGFRWFVAAAPALVVAVGVAAATQQSVYSLIPVFGAAYGLSEATLAGLVTALSAGNILLQTPLGLAAERLGGRTMILVCAVLVSICALLLPLLIGTPAMWPLLLVIGGVGYGVYTMALVELGERFAGSALVTGNAAFAVMWGAGGIVGPPGTGLVMEWLGPVGLPGMIAAQSMLLVAFALWRARRRGKGGP